jgi:hypothetical protein
LVGDGLDVGDGPDEPGPFDEPDPPDPEPEPPPEPLVGDDVGEDVGEEVLGDWVGVAAWTGGATLGGTLAPAARSCCQDHPTEPPAGTVSEPAPDDEYVHDAFEPSAHHRPQYAFAGEALTHGSLAGWPLTRHTKPGCRVA